VIQAHDLKAEQLGIEHACAKRPPPLRAATTTTEPVWRDAVSSSSRTMSSGASRPTKVGVVR
jgi:hypothetical protein